MSEQISLHYLIKLNFDRYPFYQGDDIYLQVLRSIEDVHACQVIDCVVDSESVQFTVNAELDFNIKLFIKAAKEFLDDAFTLKFNPIFSVSTLKGVSFLSDKNQRIS